MEKNRFTIKKMSELSFCKKGKKMISSNNINTK